MLYRLFLSIFACLAMHECVAGSIFSDIVTWLTKPRSNRHLVQQKKNITSTVSASCNKVENSKNAIIVLHIFNDLRKKNNDIFFAIPRTETVSQRPYHTKIRAPIVHESGIIIVPKQAVHGATSIFASFDETFDGVMKDNNNFRCQVLSIEGPFAIIQIVNNNDKSFPFITIGSINDIASANSNDPFYIINDKEVLNLNNLEIKNIDGIDYVQFALYNYKIIPGSVLINKEGLLVGIFDANATNMYNGVGNLATDPNFIRGIISRFVKISDNDDRTDFGIVVSDDFERPMFLKAKTGAIVKEVKIGSAADRSKIEVNDIIIACNGEKISNAKSLYNKLERAKMSGYVIITILRNKAEIDIELRM